MGFNPYYPRTWRKDKDSESEMLGRSHRSNLTGKRNWFKLLYTWTLSDHIGIKSTWNPLWIIG